MYSVVTNRAGYALDAMDEETADDWTCEGTGAVQFWLWRIKGLSTDTQLASVCSWMVPRREHGISANEDVN